LVCPAASRISSKYIRRVQRRPEDDPSNAQTADTISAHYRNAKVGDIAVIPKRMAACRLHRGSVSSGNIGR
jgi:hypothetical protein